MMSAPAATRLVDLLEALRLDLDRHLLARRLHLAHRLRDAAAEPDVVVLDQDPVVQPGAMVRAAAGADRVLLERRAASASSCACRGW